MLTLGSSIPPASASAVDAVYALLAIIADPAVHKERLDALVSAKAEAEAKIDGIAKAQASLEAARQQADTAADKAARQQLLATRDQAALVVGQHDLDERERAFQVRQDEAAAQNVARTAELDARMTLMNDHEQKLIDRESACTARESEIADKEAATDAALAEAQASQAQYAAKLAKLKQITTE